MSSSQVDRNDRGGGRIIPSHQKSNRNQRGRKASLNRLNRSIISVGPLRMLVRCSSTTDSIQEVGRCTFEYFYKPSYRTYMDVVGGLTVTHMKQQQLAENNGEQQSGAELK